ncbi:CopY/TcrY family copper transport repressor [Streptococcus oralis]|uniref:CopY/TcrY family copper transport repressor n=1 Tax=Streptococcus oralis TaxID=1303 RepID=UPI000FC0B6FE|nr:CopY/TcrY family copper transport repressor [Streptococcus oralis]MCP9038121.1 CopY/TcrY family copper transport repressor [Streptococcus oralis]MCP9052710.1 CopY/TcrY family copper transport repressor [Streptococcus oralis]MCP9057741.1 CopY/TcrY family copper transport repressor [Streptococcus oralis]MCP9066083.1 CopY/TcrY family copper transport repressor [Streptococcus oralis]MCP9070402.1 CopY/TcrY family copper transport repressor [Streptococcus oralis]
MQISDAEWQVMKIIWMQGEQTSSDLIRVLAERFDWSKSTIQTLLARLLEKECLTRKKEGKSFVYSALLTLDQSRDLLVQDIKDKVCSRRIKNLLADLIVECDFTLADLEDLEAVISKKKSSAVTEVRCNCMQRRRHVK